MNPSLIYFGTDEFARVILQKLLDSKSVNILAVITQPDKPAGRLQKLAASPVKTMLTARATSPPLLQPDSLKNDAVVHTLASYNADVFVVAAYGKLIPKTILSLPSHGTLNIHPSLLPEYRGAAPLQQALVDGKEKTGTTIMVLDQEMDHGPVVAQREVMIAPDETFPMLRERMATVSAELLLNILPHFLNKTVQPHEQNHGRATYTILLTRESGRIDWRKTAHEIYNLWRAMTPWPGVFTQVSTQSKTMRLKLLELKPVIKGSAGASQPTLQTGALFARGDNLFAAAGKGFIQIITIQPEGKKQMSGPEFIQGFKHCLSDSK